MTIRKYQYDDSYFIKSQEGFFKFSDYEEEQAYSYVINNEKH